MLLEIAICRSRGYAVRLEVQQDCPRHIADQLLQTFNLTGDDLYQVDGPINFLRLMPVISEVDRPDLKFRPFVPAVVSGSAHQEDIFSQIRHKPILLHHPYESSQTVLDFIEQAAEDPHVLASLDQFSQIKECSGIAQRDEDDCSAVIADDEEVDLLVKRWTLW